MTNQIALFVITDLILLSKAYLCVYNHGSYAHRIWTNYVTHTRCIMMAFIALSPQAASRCDAINPMHPLCPWYINYVTCLYSTSLMGIVTKLKYQLLQFSFLVDDDYTKCPVCLNIYIDPCNLSCGHTFCQLCLAHMWESNKNTCPVCKEIWKVFPAISFNYRWERFAMLWI